LWGGHLGKVLFIGKYKACKEEMFSLGHICIVYCMVDIYMLSLRADDQSLLHFRHKHRQLRQLAVLCDAKTSVVDRQANKYWHHWCTTEFLTC
jgi:hypothetical protein